MRIIGLSLILMGAVAAVGLAGPDTPPPPEKKRPAKPRSKFTIGKETTYVAGPVDKDGRIDYATALNERLKKGVTPETNANVLLWRALGPKPEGRMMSPEYFQELGIVPPPEMGDYFIDFYQYARDHFKALSADERAALELKATELSRRPWKADEHLEVAAWLKANEKPLALIVEATKRPQYFSPLIPGRNDKGSGGLISSLLPGVQKSRGLTMALTTRAMLRVSRGEYDAAWTDLQACHRLGRLVVRGSTLIDVLVGNVIDSIAIGSDLAFLDRGRPDAKRVEACLRDLRALPPLPDPAAAVDLGERFSFLDVVMTIDRQGISYLGLSAILVDI